MESSVNNVRYPLMRAEVIGAVQSLADPDYQWRVWVRREYPKPGYYDDFAMNIHILFDDTTVLEDPDGAVGDILRSPAEAEALRRLAEALNHVLDTVGRGDEPDQNYLESAHWSAVIEAADAALHVLTSV